MADKSAKTEKPSAKRLREARQQGQIPKSTDLVSWTAVLLATFVIPLVMGLAADRLRTLLDQMSEAVAQPNPDRALAFLGQGLWTAALMAMPLVLSMMVIGIAMNLAQVGWSVSSKRLRPKMSRLNPIKGFKRIFSAQTAWEAAKTVLRLLIMAGITAAAVQGIIARLSDAGRLSAQSAMTMMGHESLELVRSVAAASLVLSGIDYLVQRRRVGKELMMTRQEVREEHRQQEGDPYMRGAVRSRQMAMSRNRMMAEVANADVVVVNPTHVAVALVYDPVRGAPKVVAKGLGEVAARIRERAEEHAVPIVQDQPLARTLHKVCDLGDEIPVDLYDAVARLLAFIFTLKATGRSLTGELHPPVPLLTPA